MPVITPNTLTLVLQLRKENEEGIKSYIAFFTLSFFKKMEAY